MSSSIITTPAEDVKEKLRAAPITDEALGRAVTGQLAVLKDGGLEQSVAVAAIHKAIQRFTGPQGRLIDIAVAQRAAFLAALAALPGEAPAVVAQPVPAPAAEPSPAVAPEVADDEEEDEHAGETYEEYEAREQAEENRSVLLPNARVRNRNGQEERLGNAYPLLLATLSDAEVNEWSEVHNDGTKAFFKLFSKYRKRGERNGWKPYNAKPAKPEELAPTTAAEMRSVMEGAGLPLADASDDAYVRCARLWDSHKPREGTEAQAMAWARQRLADGPYPRDLLFSEGEREGHPQKRVDKVCHLIGVTRLWATTGPYTGQRVFSLPAAG